MTSCKDGHFDSERKTKERGSPNESSFKTLEQARKESGGDEATLDLMFAPAEALQALRKPFRIQAALRSLDSEPVFHELPYSLALRVSGELNKIENYGPPYSCAFHEDFLLRLRGGTKDLIFKVCLGCDEFMIEFGGEPLPHVAKLSFAPELEKTLTEVLDELQQQAKK